MPSKLPGKGSYTIMGIEIKVIIDAESEYDEHFIATLNFLRIVWWERGRGVYQSYQGKGHI